MIVTPKSRVLGTMPCLASSTCPMWGRCYTMDVTQPCTKQLGCLLNHIYRISKAQYNVEAAAPTAAVTECAYWWLWLMREDVLHLADRARKLGEHKTDPKAFLAIADQFMNAVRDMSADFLREAVDSLNVMCAELANP